MDGATNGVCVCVSVRVCVCTLEDQIKQTPEKHAENQIS